MFTWSSVFFIHFVSRDNVQNSPLTDVFGRLNKVCVSIDGNVSTFTRLNSQKSTNAVACSQFSCASCIVSQKVRDGFLSFVGI